MSFWVHLLHFLHNNTFNIVTGLFLFQLYLPKEKLKIMSLFILKNTKFPFKQRESRVQSYKVQKAASTQAKKKMF